MNDYIKEINLENQPKHISIDKMKIIIKQMENNICKIKYSTNETGTGFFAIIPFPDTLNYLPVLITNNHVINETDYNNGNFQISLNDEKRVLNLLLNNQRKFYTNANYDITIIEIKPDIDGINLEYFFDVEIKSENLKNNEKKTSIYLLQYPYGKDLSFSDGVIKNIAKDNYKIYHSCTTKPGSSGSPLIILDSDKVIGLHTGIKNDYSSNVGTLLKLPIEDFNKKMKTKNLNEIFEEIQDKKINILAGINIKKELFYLFVNLNNKVFQKKYCGELFVNFLKNNEVLIKGFFGNEIQYNEILNHLNEIDEKRNEEEKNLLEIIKNDINNHIERLYNIIASFYYILFYKLKDCNQFREMSNLGNVYINLIFENFINYLSINFKNLDNNLFISLQKLYSKDIQNLINQKYYDYNTSTYSFTEIDSILLKNQNMKEYYKLIKEEYQRVYNDNTLTYIGKFLKSNFLEVILSDFEKCIKLEPIEKIVCSNTITIIIDEYLLEDIKKNNLWNDFMNNFKDKTIFYFLDWPCFSKENDEKKNDINNIENKAKIIGKILSYILLSNNFFTNFKINLVGLGLGNLVIKYCIEELYKMYNISIKFFVNLNNVILISSNPYIINNNSWKKYVEETVINKIINCNSRIDDKLNIFNNISF